MDACDAHACIQLRMLPWIPGKSNRKKCWTRRSPALWSRRCPDEAWAASGCWDSTLQISTIIKMLASLNPPLCRIMSRLPHVLFFLPSSSCCCLFPFNASATTVDPPTLVKTETSKSESKTWTRLPGVEAFAHLLARSLVSALGPTWQALGWKMSSSDGTLMKGKSQGELGSAHWPANHPVVGLCLILFYRSVTQRDN